MKMSKAIRNTFNVMITCMIGLVFLGCPREPSVTPQPPVVTDQALCAEACQHLNKLGCDEGLPIDMGKDCMNTSDCNDKQVCSDEGRCVTTCEVFCVDTENQGVWLDPGCVSTIEICQDIENCPMAKPKMSGAQSCNESSCPLPQRH